MSPGFPELWSGDEDCTITIEKTHAGIMQLKIDFVHFTIKAELGVPEKSLFRLYEFQGQPNRTTGECDEDAMILGGGESKFSLCGQNHGQHIYYTLSSKTEAREADDLAGTASTRLTMRMRGAEMPRLWLLRLAQMPLAYSAPHECLQYYTADNGTIKTFNYATNGRHLANQDYKVCIRRNTKRCSVRYAPCDTRAFRIGPVGEVPNVIDPAVSLTPNPQVWSYITSWMWGQRSGRSLRWSPYAQHYSDDDQYRYFGYGNFGVGMTGHGRQRCQDRITIPCENEYFVTGQYYGVGVCDPHHCGNTFCPGQSQESCRIETSVTPFAVSIHFGPPTMKRNPEENIGMCLKYSQQHCDS
ncbi:putative conserved secreted protein, partial [Operophtera brumata]